LQWINKVKRILRKFSFPDGLADEFLAVDHGVHSSNIPSPRTGARTILVKLFPSFYSAILKKGVRLVIVTANSIS